MKEIINVTRSSMPPMEEYIEEIKPLWETRWLTNMGDKHKQLEAGLKKYLNVPNLSLMTNGHFSLELTLQALNLSGEVITTPYTFVSTTHAIVRNRLNPVFCDINPVDYTIDVEKLERLITPRTSAIVPVHVYGNLCDVKEIERLAKKHGLKVIYDAAHAFGVTRAGESVGGYGDASIYSFHATKAFNTIEGGAVAFHDEELGMRLYNLKNFGIRGPERVDSVGANAKMNEFQAAMGLCNLRHIGEAIADRGRVKEIYQERLQGVEGIKLLQEQENTTSNNTYFPIFVDWKLFGKSRNEIHAALEAEGIRTRKYFYPLTSEFECYRGRFRPEETPVALETSRRVLSLPIYEGLPEEEVHRICNILLRK